LRSMTGTGAAAGAADAASDPKRARAAAERTTAL
jgi:hypothetical protein